MTNFANVDDQEINKFDRISKIWWDPKGEMGALHTINPLRTKFILEHLNVRSPRILDVGCGGGILSEALAESGAQVLGIDLSQASLEVARQHAQGRGLNVNYQYKSVEEVAQQYADNFDAVTCMEMLEHVPEPGRIVAACSQILKPGGQIFFSTINRTPEAFLLVIIGGEYILHLLPRGTHNYAKFIRPRELKGWARENGLEFVRLSSLIYNPFTRKFKVVEGKEHANYMVHFIKK